MDCAFFKLSFCFLVCKLVKGITTPHLPPAPPLPSCSTWGRPGLTPPPPLPSGSPSLLYYHSALTPTSLLPPPPLLLPRPPPSPPPPPQHTWPCDMQCACLSATLAGDLCACMSGRGGGGGVIHPKSPAPAPNILNVTKKIHQNTWKSVIITVCHIQTYKMTDFNIVSLVNIIIPFR